MKHNIRRLLLFPFLPLLFIVDEIFGKPSNIRFIFSQLEKVFGTKISEVDIGNESQNQPLEYFFRSTLMIRPTQKQLQELVKAIGITKHDLRVERSSMGYIFVFTSKAMEIVKETCDRTPSQAQQWMKKIRETRWLFVSEDDMETAHWSVERQLLIFKYMVLISMPKKMHKMRMNVWGWILHRFDPLPPEKKNVSMQAYFDGMPVGKAIRHLEYLVEKYPPTDIGNAIEAMKQYGKKDQKTLRDLLDMTLMLEKRNRDLLISQRMRKEQEQKDNRLVAK